MNLWPGSTTYKLKPLKRVCAINPEILSEQSNPDFEMRYIDIGNVSLEHGIESLQEFRFEDSPSRARKPVRNGDTLISTVRTYLKAIALVEGASPNWIASTGFAVCRPKSFMDARYLFRIAQSTPFVESVVAASTGVSYPAINPSTLGGLLVPVPDLPTQKAIATFLDRETGRIDQLIEKKQRLVELLEEKQSTQSTQLLLGQDSGYGRKQVDLLWADSIPDRWSIQSVGMLFSMGRGRVLSHEEIADNPGNYPVYSSQTENDGVMGKIATFEFEGDYLTWTTDGAKAGTVFRRTGRFNCTNVCGTLKPLSAATSLDFFQAILSLATASYVRHDINPKLMNQVMARIKIPVPSFEEQQSISKRLKNQSAPISEIVKKTNQSIQKLQESRSALITAAVTGQLDIQTWGKRGETDRRLEGSEEALEGKGTGQREEIRDQDKANHPTMLERAHVK